MSRISLGLAAVFQFDAGCCLGLLPDQLHLLVGLLGHLLPLLLLHPPMLLPSDPQLMLCHSLEKNMRLDFADNELSSFSPFHRLHVEDCRHCFQERKESAGFPSKEAPWDRMLWVAAGER